MATSTLSLVTLNTWKCDGDYFRRAGRIAEGLKALGPDVVLLQEVFASACGGIHTGEAVCERLRHTHVHAPARRKPRTIAGAAIESTSGLSVLTRLAVLGVETLDLPSDPADGERIAQVVALRWRGVTLGIVNTHLTHLDDADVDAAVLGGDFNAEPDEAPIRWLANDCGFRVTDAAAACGGHFPTLTGPGHRTIGPRGIDYLFVIERSGRARLRVVSADRVLDAPDPETGDLPSDHLGVRAVLSLA